jgi:hypothetical protein
MLPVIVMHARFIFQHLDAEARDEAVQEVVANACQAYARLVERNCTGVARPFVLAWYGIRQYREGRRVGTPLNVKDVSSSYAQQRKGITVERLDKYDREDGCWQEILIEDRNSTPADLAASRIDFPAWLATLSRRDRKIALKLAVGESTGRTARQFRLSKAPISQLRRELKLAWERFTGDATDGELAAA